MKVRRRAPAWLSQILATMIAVAICAPLLHFFASQFIEPAPPAHSLDAITSALGSGIATGELDVQFAPPPSPSQQDAHDRALSLAVADRLGVAPGAVRVLVAKRSTPLDWLNSSGSMQQMPDRIVGDFTAALHMGDGRWRVVRSANRLLTP